jgi:hypothetical protein
MAVHESGHITIGVPCNQLRRPISCVYLHINPEKPSMTFKSSARLENNISIPANDLESRLGTPQYGTSNISRVRRSRDGILSGGRLLSPNFLQFPENAACPRGVPLALVRPTVAPRWPLHNPPPLTAVTSHLPRGKSRQKRLESRVVE